MNNDQQMELVRLTVKAVQDINTDTALTAEQKADAIKKLPGIPKEKMYEYLNTNYRTGPDITEFIRQFVSKNRPRGGPDLSRLLKRKNN